jgi:PAS domain S-box-containing protein
VDLTATGILPFVLAAAYSVFGMGMFDIVPVARDALLDHVDDAVFVVHGDGRLADNNRAGERFLSADGAEPVGRPFAAVAPVLARELGPLDTAERERRRVTLAGDDRERHCSALVSPIVEEASVAGHAVLLRDVTEIVEYQRRLEHENERLDEFASVVSHDLRNPLSVMSASLEIAEETGEAE